MKLLDVYVNVNILSFVMTANSPAQQASRIEPKRCKDGDMDTGKTFSIGELSREFSLTTRTMRFYEDQSLLNPLRVGQKRIYSVRDRARLKLILRGKRLGFSIKEIKDMIDLYDAADGERGQLQDFIARMQRRRAVLLEQRDDIEHVLGELDRVQSRCEVLLDQHLRNHQDEAWNSD